MRAIPSTARRLVFPLCACLIGFGVPGASGAEKKTKKDTGELTTLSKKRYQNVRIIQVDPNGIFIRHRDGIAKVLFDDLPSEERNKYRYDRERSEAFVADPSSRFPEPVAAKGSGKVVRKEGGREAKEIAEEIAGAGRAAATDVNVNVTVRVVSAASPGYLISIPYPYYRYPETRGLQSNRYLRPFVFRPYPPYNSYSYLRKQGFFSSLSLGGGCRLPASAVINSRAFRLQSERELFLHSNLLHGNRPFGAFTYPWF